MRKVTRIDKLTKKQIAAMPGWRDRWVEIGLRTGETDWAAFEAAAEICYKKSGLQWHGVVARVSSPIVGAFAAPLAANILVGLQGNAKAVDSAVDSAVHSAVDSAVYSAVDSAVHSAVDSAVYSAVGSAVHSAVDSAVHSAVDSAVDSAVHSAVDSAVHSAVDSAVHSAVGSAVWWHQWFGGQLWPSWAAWESFYREVCGLYVGDRDLAIAYAATVSSVSYWWPNQNFIIVSARPSAINRNASGQLHADRKKAIEWPDGWGLWMLNGVQVPDWLVTEKAEVIDPKKFAKIENVEIRREFVRKVGIERIASGTKAKRIDKSGDGMYELLVIDLGERVGKHPYLKMRNPSIGVYHLEAVAKECRTVEAAIKWRNGSDKLPKELS